jgi:protein TonB
MFMTGRHLASDEEKITRLIITLDINGKLIKVQVLGPSGITDLDDAAIEAFQAAAPFPNPPKGIVEADGTIKIRWDFVLEANSTIFSIGKDIATNSPPAP